MWKKENNFRWRWWEKILLIFNFFFIIVFGGDSNILTKVEGAIDWKDHYSLGLEGDLLYCVYYYALVILVEMTDGSFVLDNLWNCTAWHGGRVWLARGRVSRFSGRRSVWPLSDLFGMKIWNACGITSFLLKGFGWSGNGQFLLFWCKFYS